MSNQVTFTCQVSVKRILFSQALSLQAKKKQESEKEERRAKAEEKRRRKDELTSDAGIPVKSKPPRSDKKNLNEVEVSTEEALNLGELPSFHRLSDLDEEEQDFVPTRQPFETNKYFRIFDGQYQIFNNDDFTIVQSIQEARFKGTIPCDSPEYLYLFKVIKCTDIRGEFFRIDKILAMSRNDLSNNIITSIFKRDLKQEKNKIDRILEAAKIRLNSGDTMEYKDFCAKIPSDWLIPLREGSAFFANYDKFPVKTLIHCFPNDFLLILDLKKNRPDEFINLWTIFLKEMSSFFFQPICSEYGLTSPLHLMSYMTWFLQNAQQLPGDVLNDSPAIKNEKIKLIVNAVELYKKIKAVLKVDGSTAFLVDHINTRVFPLAKPDDIPTDLEKLDSFQLLITNGTILREQYGGFNVYAPRSSGKATKVFYNLL